MEKIRVAINGFGRIGRITLREMMKNDNLDIVAINDLTSPDVLAYLLKYDSNHGRFPYSVEVDGNDLIINGNERLTVYSERDPEALPWGELNIDVVLESTGVFRKRDQIQRHINAGAKRVVLSAPAKSGDVKTLVRGVNDHDLTPEDVIVSNASCTTNCLAPVAKVLLDTFGIESGLMTTVHAYTNDQRILDAPHKDLRRGRNAASSIIPTSTGAAKAVGLVIPELEGKMDGMAMRVPVPTGSIVDTIFTLSREVTMEEVNKAVKEASETSMKGIIEYTEDAIVSVDIVSSPYSCIYDSEMTKVMGNKVKVLTWYDNEYGYSARTAEIIEMVGKMIGAEATA